ncbi:helicase-related protein [Limosilactobacillus fermentum]|nr:helicase-related protein [Limosilactobacillus fermentum]
MDYFTPKFFLGMTATPERSDDFNIFNLFHYNVAYEIRLQQALELNMLAPFHYVGLTDYAFADQYEEEVDQYRNRKQGSKPSRKQEQRAVELLTSKERVNYILEQTDYYGYSGPVLHGLVFCSSVAEAEALARAFTAAGHPAKALSGADNGDRRRQVVHELENGLIEYIITVDIFNEGIDIPASTRSFSYVTPSRRSSTFNSWGGDCASTRVRSTSRSSTSLVTIKITT